MADSLRIQAYISDQQHFYSVSTVLLGSGVFVGEKCKTEITNANIHSCDNAWILVMNTLLGDGWMCMTGIRQHGRHA